MKLLIFSDSHGRYANMQRVINLHPGTHYLLHLGDGIKDINSIVCLPPIQKTVNGNFEDGFFGSNEGNSTACIEVCGKKIFMCHGHRHNVNYSMQNLIYAAMEQDADIALYGHTHKKHNEYIPAEKLPFPRKNGLYIFNPGSITLPRDSLKASFGILEIKDNGLLLSHGNI